MTDFAQAAWPPHAVADDLAQGNLFVEVQVPAWPPGVTQTLVRQRDGRRALTVRAKPSGRLRVELARAGHETQVVRTVHLRLRAPGLLRLNVAWRGDDVVVAAGGQIIGSSREFSPEGIVAPEMVEETEAPLDHVGNEQARLVRRRRTEVLLQEIGGEASPTTGWFVALARQVQIAADLTALVREGRHHHLAGLAEALARLVAGDAPLLQSCAAVADAPLLVHAPVSPAPQQSPAGLLAAAFDVAPARDEHHPLAVDLDIWLHHEHPWSGGRQVPVETLLLAVAAALVPARPDHEESDIDRQIRSAFAQGQPVAGFCAFASTVCGLAAAVAAKVSGAVTPPVPPT